MQADDKDDEAATTTIPIPISVALAEEDIPGAALDEPLEAKQRCSALVAAVSRHRGSIVFE